MKIKELVVKINKTTVFKTKSPLVFVGFNNTKNFSAGIKIIGNISVYFK